MLHGGRRPAAGPAGADLDPDLCRHRRAVQLQRPRPPLLSARAVPSRAISQVNLLPKGERTRASHDIALDIRQRLAGLADARRAPPSRSSRCRRVRRCSRRCSPRSTAPTPTTRRAVAAKVREAFQSVPFVVDVDDSYGTAGRPAALRDRPGESRIPRRRGAGDVYDTIARHHRRREGRLFAARRRPPADRDRRRAAEEREVARRALLSTPMPAGGTARQGANRRARRRRPRRRASRPPTRSSATTAASPRW